MLKMCLSTLCLALACSIANGGNSSQIKSNFVLSSYAKTQYSLVFAHGMGGFIRAGTDELGVDY